MKKYLVLLILATIISLSFIGCESLVGYEGMAQSIIGFEYVFTSHTLKRSTGNSFNCEIDTLFNSPVYKQYHIGAASGYPQTQVEGLSKGDTLTIYCYEYFFTDTADKSTEDHVNYFKNNYKNDEYYYKDSVVIIGPSFIYNYALNGDTLKLTVVNSMCP